MAGDATQEDIIFFYTKLERRWLKCNFNYRSYNRVQYSMTKFKRTIQKSIFSWVHGVQVRIHLHMAYTGAADQYNFSRYTSDFLEEIFVDIDSPKAFDAK